MCQASLRQRHSAAWRVRQAPGPDGGRLLLCRRHDRRAILVRLIPSPRSNNALLLLLLFREQPRVAAHRRMQIPRRRPLDSSPAARACSPTTASSSRNRSRAPAIAGPALVEVGLAVVGSLNVREQARPDDGGTGRRDRRDPSISARWRATRSATSTGWNPNAPFVWWRGRGRWLPAHCTSLGQGAARPDDRRAGGCTLYPTSAEPFPARTERSITTQAKLIEGSGARQGARATRSTRARPRRTWARWPSRSATSRGRPPPSRWPHRRVG